MDLQSQTLRFERNRTTAREWVTYYRRAATSSNFAPRTSKELMVVLRLPSRELSDHPMQALPFYSLIFFAREFIRAR